MMAKNTIFMPDTKCSCTISGYGSVSKKTYQNMPLIFNHEKTGRKDHIGVEDGTVLLSLNPKSKSLNTKSLNKSSSFSCSKRQRRDESNVFTRKAGDDDLVTKKIRHDHVRCISSEKFQIVKQKLCQDGKIIDKKSFKARSRAKFDPSTSKAVFISSDSASRGIGINGIHCLKTDLHDITKHVEEFSLNELLDVSFKYPNLFPKKRKKASDDNENILNSVRKVFSILPSHGAPDSSDNRRALISLREPSLSLADMKGTDEKDRCIEGLSCKDPCPAELNTLSLYHPKDILERLELSPTLDPEALISNLNLSQSASLLKDFYATSLPPFPWSFSHGGTCKPGSDSCKLTMSRSAGQSKWVSIGNDCFSNPGMETFDHNGDCTNQQKTDELLQDVKSLIESIMPQFDGPQKASESCAFDPGACSLNSRKLELPDGHAGISHSRVQGDSKDCLFHQNSVPEAGLRCLGNELNSRDSPKFDSPDSVVGLQEQPKRTADGCSSKSSTGACGQSIWHSAVPELYTPGHSPQLLAAAAILCEMTCCSNGTRAEFDNFTAIKDHSISSLEKSEKLFMVYKHHDAFKHPSLLSTQHEMVGEKKNDFHRLFHGKSMRPSGMMQSTPRVTEKVLGNHEKLCKGRLNISSAGLDRSRGRSKMV